jgi:hypothetical protein
MSAADVWIAKDDGSDLIRAVAIVGVGRDYNGNVTARLSGGEQPVVTLVDASAHRGQNTPDEFHVRLIEVITQLSDTPEPAIIRPVHDEERGWTWRPGPL